VAPLISNATRSYPCLTASDDATEESLLPLKRLPECPEHLTTFLTNLKPLYPSGLTRDPTAARPDVRNEFALANDALNVPPLLGVVISTHNEAKNLRMNLGRLLRYTSGVWSLAILLDDCHASDDSTAAIASELSDYLHAPTHKSAGQLQVARIIRVASPGFYEVAAINLGLRLLSPSKFYVVLQADIILNEPGWNALALP